MSRTAQPWVARAWTRWVATILVVPAVFLFGMVNAPSAAAQWRTNEVASMTVRSGTLAKPTSVTVPASAWMFVRVSWTPGVGTITPEGYYVTRVSGGVSTAACDSSPSSLLTGTTCMDSWVPRGDYTYVVTAAYRSWTSPSLPSGKVSVSSLFGLGFVEQPTANLSTDVTRMSVMVEVVDDSGSTARVADVPVTLGLQEDSGDGSSDVLATAKTNARGIATFEDVALDTVAGEDYVLTATSPGLEEAVSEPFTVSDVPVASSDLDTYSVLARGDVTAGDGSKASGDVGAGGSVKGLDAASVRGGINVGEDAAGALEAFEEAHADESARTPDTELAATLTDTTLHGGVHHRAGSLDVSGTLTLDAKGDPDATFVVQAGDLRIAPGTTVRLANGAAAANVVWITSGGVRIGAGSSLAGAVMAAGSIVIDKGTQLFGQALSSGDVTLTGVTLSDAGEAETIIDAGSPTGDPQVDPTPSATPTAGEPAPTESASPSPTKAAETPAPEEKPTQEATKKAEPAEPSTPPEPPVPTQPPEPAKTTEPPAPSQTESAEPADPGDE